jgi:hypothetical protein
MASHRVRPSRCKTTTRIPSLSQLTAVSTFPRRCDTVMLFGYGLGAADPTNADLLVTNGTGTVPDGDISNVTVTCQ